MTTIKEAISTSAAKHGVPVILAEATAWHESSLSPTAVGDDGTSFGLYQLHEGGELGTLTKEQAFNPETNADVALSEFADVKRNNPDISGGAWAAAAQRPAEPTAYAAAVDAIIAEIEKGNGAISEALAKDDTVTTAPTTTTTTTTPAPTAVVTKVNVSLPLLKQGMTGPPVTALQYLVTGTIAKDGIFGPLTEQALRFTQNEKHIASDGIVGTATWEALIGVPLVPMDETTKPQGV